jgi:hypothetical protein
VEGRWRFEHLLLKRPLLPPNKSLQRSGGQWYLVCKSLAGMDKLPMISLGEPPGAELSRWATLGIATHWKTVRG